MLIRCPTCDHDTLIVDAITYTKVTLKFDQIGHDLIDSEDTSTEWDKDSAAECDVCGWTGQLKDAMHEEEPSNGS